MSVGKTYPCVWSTYNDPETGIEVKKLTQDQSEHLYFNRSGWYDNETKLLYRSLRTGIENLFTMDLLTGESVQLTDFKDIPIWGDSAFINSMTGKVYFLHNHTACELDMETLETRVIYEIAEGCNADETICSPDGRYVYLTEVTDKFNQFDIFRLGSCAYDYRKEMNKFHEQDIRSKIIRIEVESGNTEVIYEEDSWVSHLDLSPADQNLLLFCHQGKTMKHRNRIWAMYIDERKPWAVAPTHHDVLGITHEHWLSDGIHIAYQAKGKLNGIEMFHGVARFDNQSKVEYRVPVYGAHHSSRRKEYFISDGNFTDQQYLYLFRANENGYDEPQKICFHGTKIIHAHPAISPEEKYLLFSSDKDGESAMYMIDMEKVL
ncbi:MAG: oligogalacturonate lyase family protein [Planctomycetota bacterium]|jgi:oligogalacturonide lyase